MTQTSRFAIEETMHMIRERRPKTGFRVVVGSSLFAFFLLTLTTLTARADDPGAAVYKAKCASCHGADGSGNTPAGKSLKVRDLRSPEVQKMSDAELIAATTNGKGKMPAYGSKLSAEQIKQLVAAIRAMAPK
jgi:mono/diheme cytochrome c family protein